MKIRPFGLRIAVSLFGISTSWAVSAQTDPATGPQAAAEDEESQQTVVVTGSRIPTVLTEGPSPVTTITKEQIEARGFTTVLEAAAALTQITGASQNELDTNGFTPNAGVVDLRSLGPGRTLILLDGRRITDYPLPYNSESNFVNLSTIPAAAVEKIELLAGGASAIYGSDAVAGVLNIVLRRTIDTPLDINVRYGDTTQGGGASNRIQGVGGWSTDTFNLTYAAEYLHRSPLYGLDRSFMDSVKDNPDPAGRINPRSLLLSDPFDLDGDGFDYIDPGSSACGPFQNMVYSNRPGRGRYCGQPNDPAQASIRNKTDRISLYTRADWTLSDSMGLYTSLNAFKSKAKLDSNFSWWTPLIPLVGLTDNTPYVFDTGTDPFGIGGRYTVLQRFFQPDEIGGRSARANNFDEHVIDAAVGLKGDLFGGGNWQYDVSLSSSRYKVKASEELLLDAAVNEYFLGDTTGVDPFFGIVPAYNVDLDRYYAPLTPAIWDQLTDDNIQHAKSWNNVAQLVVNGELFSLPAGRVAMAGIIELAKQKYDINLDDQLLNKEFWGRTDTGGDGSRKRSAIGLEFNIPVFSTLNAKAAGRYDDYNDITDVNGAFTYNLGLEFRPIRQVLLRGSLATSFRAPDMHNVFADTSGFFTTVTDEFLCRRDEPNVSFPACTNGAVNIQGARQGNPALAEEEGKSYTFGFVLEPAHGLSFKADYYKIRLTGAVLDNPLTRILEIEADCRLGETKGGQSVDPASAKCQDALARITRLPDDGTIFGESLSTIVTGPVNSAKIITSGIDAEASYAWWPTAPVGNFNFTLGWSHTLKYDEQDFEEDPLENLRDNLQNFSWRSRVNGSITWNFRNFSTTAYGERYGSIPNWAETGRIKGKSFLNLSTAYTFLDGRAQAAVFVDNVFNTNPPRDPTYDTYPYFAYQNYDPIGREWFLQLRYNFGGHN